MSTLRFPVAVHVRRVPLANRWITERWEPFAVIAVPDRAVELEAPTPVPDADAGTIWRFDNCTVELHRSEAEGYYLNLTAPEAKIFVMWRATEDGSLPPLRPIRVTVSYNEAARSLDGGECVDALPIPDAILHAMREFAAIHYQPERKKKAHRNNPDANGEFRREPGVRR